MKCGREFEFDAVPMLELLLADNGIESILTRTVMRPVAHILKTTFPDMDVQGSMIDANGVLNLLVRDSRRASAEWRAFLGTDGTGDAHVFIDTGSDLREADLLDISELGVSGPCDLMQALSSGRLLVRSEETAHDMK